MNSRLFALLAAVALVPWPAWAQFCPPITLSWASSVSCQPGSNCCGYAPQRRTASFLSSGAGDGSAASAGLTRVYDVLAATPAYHEPRLYYTEDRCAVEQACSPGSMLYEWTCGTYNFPGYERAVKDKRGHWTVNLRSPAPPGKPRALSELTAVLKGATDANGTGALERVDYSYQYGRGDTQFVSSEQRASLLAPPGSPDPFARVLYIREPPGTPAPRADALQAVIRSGWTRVWTGGAWSLRKHFIGTFYLPTRTGESTTDPQGRPLEVQGPCEVDSETATGCRPGPRPVRQHHYYPATAPARLRHRLEREVLYPDGDLLGSSNPVQLTFRYLGYDEYGNPTQVEDANGVLFQREHSAGRLVSFRVGSQPPTSLGHEGDKVRFIRQPAGNYEVFCYRKDLPGEACRGGTLTSQLQWRARSATEDGSDWTEKVVYTWWEGGTLKEERFLARQGQRVETRRVLQYAADAHQRPTWRGWGEGPGSFAATHSFDGANNLTGMGLAYNRPPAWCNVNPTTGQPLSPLCAALAYDRADRLVQLDEFPNPGAAGQRTLLQRDRHGHVSALKVGCRTTDDFSSCGQPSTLYTYDDFGQVMEAWLPSAEGPVRFGYNAQGAQVVVETEAMRQAGEWLAYAYDSLARPLSAAREYTRPTPGREVLYRLQYDTSPEVPGPGCPQPLHTRGRLRYREDSFGRTWYQYTEQGAVAAEIRERAGSQGCTGSSYNAPHTFYTYTPNGEPASILYPYGRAVYYVYGTGAEANRVVDVDVALREATGWVRKRLLSNIRWEPYGDLRGYQLHHLESGTTSSVEYGLGGNAEVVPTGCSSTLPSARALADPSDLTGRLRSLRVSSGAAPPGTGSGDIYQRHYTWRADQVVRTDTCLLGSTAPQTETFQYDAVLRLTQATGSLSTTGGTFDSRAYGYNGRGSRTSEEGDALAWSFTYTPGARLDWLNRRTAAQGLLGYGYTADADGRVLSKSGPATSTGAPAFVLDFTSGLAASGASVSALRSIRVNGGLFSYSYDAWQRRWLKVYPSGVRDEFFYNLDKELLVDQGNASSRPASTHPVDEYVWLAGRPVVMVRGKLDARWRHLPDSTEECARDGEPARCGVYYPVTDHIGKPVLMLDSQQLIAGVGEYDPFGHVNRVSVQVETPHPYNDFSGRLAPALRQPVVPGTVLQQRALFDVLELYGDWMDCASGGSDSSDAVYLRDVSTQAPLTRRYTASSASGNFWTEWFTPSARGAEAVLENIGTCTQQANCNGLSCQPGACVCGVSRPKSQVGAVISAYEYRRFQTGASPLWPPLRLPGQYHDAESDLFENWHRYYDPSTGRYLQPEPYASTVPTMATESAYAYAKSNPLHFTDPTGLYLLVNKSQCPNWDAALLLAREKAGCNGGGSCTCKKDLPCDICTFLQEGAWPIVSIEPFPSGLPAIPANGATYRDNLPRYTPGAMPDHYVVIRKMLCTGAANISILAQTMLHEALHMCKYIGGTGRAVEDGAPLGHWFRGPDAEELTSKCFSSTGGEN
jgi:RHS repeat-associated protein